MDKNVCYATSSRRGALTWTTLAFFGGFAIPPVMGLFVKLYGIGGYASGFSVFLILAVIALILFAVLNRYAPVQFGGIPNTA